MFIYLIFLKVEVLEIEYLKRIFGNINKFMK